MPVPPSAYSPPADSRPAGKTRLGASLKAGTGTAVTAFLTAVMALIQAGLLAAAVISPGPVSSKDVSATPLWTYSRPTNQILSADTTYALTTYGMAVIVIGCLILLAVAYLAYAWYREELKKLTANKRAWAGAAGGSLAFFAVCAIVGLVAVSPSSAAYPSEVSAAGVGERFGLAFAVAAATSNGSAGSVAFSLTLAPTPFGGFAVAMQFVLTAAAVGWFCAFCLSFQRVSVQPRQKKDKAGSKGK